MAKNIYGQALRLNNIQNDHDGFIVDVSNSSPKETDLKYREVKYTAQIDPVTVLQDKAWMIPS